MIFNKDFSYGFNENACQECGGKCCTGESGNIFANKEELKALREHLQLDEKEFALKYLKKVGFRMSFKEVEFEDGFACIFFDKEKEIALFMIFVRSNAAPFLFGNILKHIKRS